MERDINEGCAVLRSAFLLGPSMAGAMPFRSSNVHLQVGTPITLTTQLVFGAA
jgi:hypothetical protein